MDVSASDHKIQIQINKIKNLPPLSEASLRILDAVNNPDVDVDELTDALAQSPELVARLLGLANSAYFCKAGPVDDLKVAIVRVLGLNLVKSLSLSIVLNVQLDASQCPAFDSNDYWIRSIVTAIVAQNLASKVRGDRFSLSVVYTSGLLLNIGLLVAVYLFPKPINAVITHCENKYACINKQIKQVLGQSHNQLGYLLLKKWQLPEIYQNVLKNFDSVGSDARQDSRDLITLLKLSQKLSYALIDRKPIEFGKLVGVFDEISLEQADAEAVVSDMAEQQEAIREMAAVMG